MRIPDGKDNMLDVQDEISSTSSNLVSGLVEKLQVAWPFKANLWNSNW